MPALPPLNNADKTEVELTSIFVGPRHHRNRPQPSLDLLRLDLTMSKIILAANAGSSSVKISVFKTAGDKEDPKQLAEAQVAGLSAPPAKLTYSTKSQNVKDREIKEKVGTQDEAFKYLLDQLFDDESLEEVKDAKDISTVCHRVVHGGDYEDAQVITKETYHHIEKLTDLAPLSVYDVVPLRLISLE